MDQYTANKLIQMIKELMDDYTISLSPGTQGKLKVINRTVNHEFTLDYWVSNNVEKKASFHLRENRQNISLTRVNIDPNGFHKNANGEHIRGDRLLLYSQDEKESHPHSQAMKAEPLQKTDFPNQDSLINIFISYLEYNNIKNDEKITVENQILH